MSKSSNSDYRTVIQPVATSATRTLWSVMIPTYNCANYLRQTLSSVLAQDPGPEVMQIRVVDDYSTQDDPEAIVTEIGRDRVEFYRQSRNRGYIANFTSCLEQARGQLVHLLHGDDYVLNGFYQKLQQGFEQNSEIGAAFCRHVYVDEQGQHDSYSALESSTSGVLENWLERIATGQRIATPSIVVRRKVYEHLGAFDSRFKCAGEDWEMWVRIAACYPVWFEPEVLAAYRITRPGSLTESAIRNSRLVQDMRQAVEIIESYLPDYLPPSQARKLLRQSRKMYASWALKGARELLSTKDFKSAQAQIQEALRCSKAIDIWLSVIQLEKQFRMAMLQSSLKSLAA